MPEIIETCPLGKECVRVDNGTITHRCRWYMPFTTFPTPQHKQPVEVWKCAHVWLPNLIVEMLTLERDLAQKMQQPQAKADVIMKQPYRP